MMKSYKHVNKTQIRILQHITVKPFYNKQVLVGQICFFRQRSILWHSIAFQEFDHGQFNQF